MKRDQSAGGMQLRSALVAPSVFGFTCTTSPHTHAYAEGSPLLAQQSRVHGHSGWMGVPIGWSKMPHCLNCVQCCSSVARDAPCKNVLYGFTR